MELSKKNLALFIAINIVIASCCGILFGFLSGNIANEIIPKINNFFGIKDEQQVSLITGTNTITSVKEQSAIIDAVKKTSKAVVSIVISKDLPKIEKYFYNPFGESSPFQFEIPGYKQEGTEEKTIGGGTGFIISANGLIVTNKHVVYDEEAKYTVVMEDGKQFEAKVLARDPANDIAIIKIEVENLPVVELGDSSNLELGQTVIAIGNALGEFSNSVSAGVVSGLKRAITASGQGIGSEQLTGIIQTDTAINSGNSGGPLLNIDGQVIGVNVAMAEGAQNIGFAIPINDVKRDIESVQKDGKIVVPFLGVRYVIINQELVKKNNLSVDYGALIIHGDTVADLAVVPCSPADKAGLQENDIILEIDGQKINDENTLSNLILKQKIGDEVDFKILSKGVEKTIKIKLEERK